MANAALTVAALGASGACELVEVEVAKPDDVVVAETMVVLASGGNPEYAMSAFALLHRTYQGTTVDPVDGAAVRLTNQDGRTTTLVAEPRGSLCLHYDTLSWDATRARDLSGAACYRTAETGTPFAPGDRLALEIVLADGMCGMRPETQQRVDWTPSDGAWAYKSEARITGHEPGAGFGPNADSLDLDLLAIGREQTGLVFPRSFGLSEYLDSTYDRDLILKLRDGLPAGASARLAVTAIDRNWMNWTRTSGISFSGNVRIPSVFGDGTGAFATGVRRQFAVAVGDDGGLPACGPEEA